MFINRTLFNLLNVVAVFLFFVLNKAASEDFDTTSGWKPYYGIQGADTASTYKIADCSFFVYKDLIIVEKELTGGEIGSNIFVKTRKGKAFPEVNCDKIIRKCDMQVLNKWAEYFLAKWNLFLIIRSENGPRRKLIVYDMGTKKIVFESYYSSPVYFNSSDELCFWLETGKANPGNCPKYNKLVKSGLTPVIETEVTFNLYTQNLSYTSDKRCNYNE